MPVTPDPSAPLGPSTPSPAARVWRAQRERIAQHLQHDSIDGLWTFIDAIPTATWPRWDEDLAWVTASPTERQHWASLGPLARSVMPEHHLLTDLLRRAGWRTDPPHLLAVLDRLIAEGEPLDRCALKIQATGPGWTLDLPPLCRAARLGKDVLVERLLRAGASPHAAEILGPEASPTGQTALCVAVRHAPLGTVQRLLAAGARPFVPHGPTQTGRESLLRTATRRFCRTPEALTESLAILDLLVQVGVPLNGPEGGENGPLHTAAEEGHPAMVERLVGWGADPERRNQDGKSAWDIAQHAEQEWRGELSEGILETMSKERALNVAAVLRKTMVAREQRTLSAAIEESTPLSVDGSMATPGTPTSSQASTRPRL